MSMIPPMRVQELRRSKLSKMEKRGGVQPGNLPTQTSFGTAPPSSTYRNGVPKIAGSEGGFFGVLFGAIIVVTLVAVGAFLFIRRRRRRRQLNDDLASRFPSGPKQSGVARAFGSTFSGNTRKGWGKMDDDDGERGGNYGDDAFEMGRGNPSTATLHAAPLSPDPSTTDLPSYLHPSSAAVTGGAWPFSGPQPHGGSGESSGNASDSSLGVSEKDGNWHHFSTPKSELDLNASELSERDDFVDAHDGKGHYETTGGGQT